MTRESDVEADDEDESVGSDGPVNVGRATVIRGSAKALLVRRDKGDRNPFWVPKSVIHDDSEVYKDTSEPGNLILKRWFAKKEGLE